MFTNRFARRFCNQRKIPATYSSNGAKPIAHHKMRPANPYANHSKKVDYEPLIVLGLIQ